MHCPDLGESSTDPRRPRYPLAVRADVCESPELPANLISAVPEHWVAVAEVLQLAGYLLALRVAVRVLTSCCRVE